MPFAFLPAPAQSQTATHAEFRIKLLALVNEERTREGLRPVELDDLASKIAEEHAKDMAVYSYCNHWGRDGRKPYMRYSFAGGTDFTGENISALSGALAGDDMPEFGEYLVDMHKSLYEEKPPNDGHRRTILDPAHTHIGFGFATVKGELRLVEEFVSRYVEIAPLPHQGKRNSTLNLTGKLLNPKHSLAGIEVYYEPLPVPPEMAWLRIGRPYGLPDERRILPPKGMALAANAGGLSPQVRLEELRGNLEIKNNGEFQANIRLFKDKPGIYTIVVWLREKPSQSPFSATNICIESN